VKTALRGIFLEGSGKYLKGDLGQRGMSRDNHLVIEGRITKTDLGTEGIQVLSSYT
jgi:hypothetical protein